MSIEIMVEDFKYIRGVNDSEYIELLKNAYERQRYIASKAIAKLKEQPEIIRCKNCADWGTNDCAMSQTVDYNPDYDWTNPEGYCYKAERRNR